jgi:putative ABC transport system permease protein
VNLSSAFALFVGMFIVHSSFSTAVTQRRKEIGLLRALGATRRQVRNLFLAESLAVGVLGSLVGVATGVLVAGAITAAFARLAAELYGLAQQPSQGVTDVRLLMLAAATGAITSVVATLLPAIHAARIQPTEALQQTVTAGQVQHSWRRPILCGALAATAAVLLAVDGPRLLSYLGYALTVVVALVAGPLLARALVLALRPAMKFWRPIEGALAGDSLLVSERTSGAILALTFSLALAIAFAGVARGAYASVVQWLDSTMNADLFVLPSQRLELHAMRFPPDMAAEIASIPGVARVQTYRSSRATFRGKPVMVAAIEMKSVRETARQRPVAGSPDTMYEAAAAGRGVLVSDNLAQSQALRLNDTIDLPAPAGTIHLPIVGILADYTDQQGTIFVDRSVFLSFWRDDMASDFRVFVAPDADAARVRQAITDRFAGRRHVFIMTNGDARQYVLGTADQWFQLIDLQVGIAVVVAILGIVNALTVSITDRRRELGVLKAVGALRGQIRRTIWLEASGVAVIGLILGAILGAVLLRFLLDIVQRDAAGLRLDYQYPFGTVAVLVPVMLAAAIAAAIWPSQVAVRGSLVEALEYE